MSYNTDFRKCLIRNIELGMSWRDAAKTFKISSRSISRWIKNIAKNGTVDDKKRKAYKPKKIDAAEGDIPA